MICFLLLRMTLAATVCSTISVVLLIVDWIKTEDFHKSGTSRTPLMTFKSPSVPLTTSCSSSLYQGAA